MNSNSPSEEGKGKVDLARRRTLKFWAGIAVGASVGVLAGTIYIWSATKEEQKVLETDVNEITTNLDEFNANVSTNMEQPGILAESITKGATLAADAAFYYAILHSRLTPQERNKLIIAITAAHGFLAAVWTLLPTIVDNPQYKKAIILCCSALAIAYVMSEQYEEKAKTQGEENEAATEDKEEKEGMLKTIAEKDTLALACSAWVLSVSFDALYASFGTYGAMDDRRLDVSDIIISNIIITVTILVLMWLLKGGLELTESNFYQILKESIGSAIWQLKDMPHFKKMSSYFPENMIGPAMSEVKDTKPFKKMSSYVPENSKEWEIFTMNAVMTLILSFGVRGIMGISEYQWHELPIGTTLEALGVSAFVMAILNHTWAGQMAAWEMKKARDAVESILTPTTT